MTTPWLPLQLLLAVSAFKGYIGKDTLFHEQLLNGYDTFIRPYSLSEKQRTNVEIELHVLDIDQIDMKRRTATIDIAPRFRWQDTRLRWNTTNDENKPWIPMDVRSIWSPDVVFGSMNTSKMRVDLGKEIAKVKSDGFVDLWPLLHIELEIDTDVLKYPYDTQTIVLIVESWIYSVNELAFVIKEGFNPISTLRTSGEWTVLGFDMINASMMYDDVDGNHQVGYKIHVKRRSLYYNLHFLAPILLISILNIFCFLLPTASGERVGLSMTIFLTLIVYLGTVSAMLPKTSLGVPIIVVYLGLQMIGSAVTIIMTVLVIHFHHKSSHINNVSNVLKAIPKCRCCHRNCKKNFYQVDENSEKDLSHEVMESFKGLSEAQAGVDKVTTELKGNPDVHHNPWERIATVVNRICFWLAILWNVVFLSTMLVYVAI